MAKEKTTESNYSATILESSRELTARERVMFKDTQNAISMNDFAEQAKAEGGKAIIENVKDFVHITVHNDKSDDKDYDNFLVIDANGEKYVTGSHAFWNAFQDIYNEMKNETEPWGVQLNLIPSKNYKGKNVLTCSLI
jgi:hypothetical protein